jgi:hypothetical protein
VKNRVCVVHQHDGCKSFNARRTAHAARDSHTVVACAPTKICSITTASLVLKSHILVFVGDMLSQMLRVYPRCRRNHKREIVGDAGTFCWNRYRLVSPANTI